MAQLMGGNDKILDNIEILSHSNETLGAIREKLLRHIYKGDLPVTTPYLQIRYFMISKIFLLPYLQIRYYNLSFSSMYVLEDLI